MKLWPQEKWKQVLLVLFLAILVVIASTAILLVYANSAVNKDVVSGIEIMKRRKQDGARDIPARFDFSPKGHLICFRERACDERLESGDYHCEFTGSV
jgi:hypothetical protein